ncbi:MAG: 23S rRNA (pseudouridine(1915)-N(3))-methyltransferase RlmH [Bacillota bacterium]
MKPMRPLTIELIAVGKMQNRDLKSAIDTYRRYLHPRWALKETEVKEARLPKNASEKDIERLKEEESKALLNATNDDAYIIALAIEGTMQDSERFAQSIREIAEQGFKHIVFWIGGSHGIHDAYKKKAHMRLSLSSMTFPHQLTRLLISEQLFRALKILSNETYHK